MLHMDKTVHMATCSFADLGLTKALNDRDLAWSRPPKLLSNKIGTIGIARNVRSCRSDCVILHFGAMVRTRLLDLRSVCRSSRGPEANV
jgi:hypothetical protein